MRIFLQLTRRHVLLYLRDRASVFFSFLSVIIIILLYGLFLGKAQINNLTGYLGEIQGIDWLVNSWIMAGILTVSTITLPLGVLGTLITDRESGKISDFYASPVKREVLALSYLMSSWVVAFCLVLLNLVLGLLYINWHGGSFISFQSFIRLLAILLLSIMSFSSLFFFISIFMKSQNAFSLLSTIVGTFIGFLGGIYIPIGSLGQGVQTFMNLLPSAYSVTLIRRVYMEGAIEQVFKGAPSGVFETYADIYGLNVKIGAYEFSSWQMLWILILFGLTFYLMSAVKLSRSKLS